MFSTPFKNTIAQISARKHESNGTVNITSAVVGNNTQDRILYAEIYVTNVTDL